LKLVAQKDIADKKHVKSDTSPIGKINLTFIIGKTKTFASNFNVFQHSNLTLLYILFHIFTLNKKSIDIYISCSNGYGALRETAEEIYNLDILDQRLKNKGKDGDNRYQWIREVHQVGFVFLMLLSVWDWNDYFDGYSMFLMYGIVFLSLVNIIEEYFLSNCSISKLRSIGFLSIGLFFIIYI
jgi:hypothetical protein